MPTYEFTPAWFGTYYSWPITGVSAGTYNANVIFQGLYGQANLFAFIGYNSADVRSKLAGQKITSSSIRFTVAAFANEQKVGYVNFGLHNYPSKPVRVDPAGHVTYPRRTYQLSPGVTYDYYLDTNAFDNVTSGVGFQSGVYTGVIFGPGPKDDTTYNAIFAQAAPLWPTLVIRTDDTPFLPNKPILRNANNGVVLDSRLPISFDFAHSDPKNSALSKFQFKRRRDGVDQWWSGSGWSATPVLLNATAAPIVSGDTRRLTIPGGYWGNRTASRPSDTWSISTINVAGYTGPYSDEMTLFASTPPNVLIRQPSGSQYRSASPTFRWVFSDPDGNPQYGWIAQIYAPSRYQQTGFSPDDYTGQLWSYSGDDYSQRSVTAGVTLDNHSTYRAYMKVVSSPNPAGGLQYSSWQFVEFTVQLEPPAPRILSPSNNATIDLGAGFIFDWEDIFSTEGGSQQQAGFAIRRHAPGAPYQWWDGQSWVFDETYLAGPDSIYTFRRGEVTNGSQYTFSVSIRDGYGLTSTYSNEITVSGSTTPQVTVVGPPGVITSLQPTVAWTLFDVENDPQQTYQVRIVYSGDFDGATSLDPATVPAVWDSGVVADTAARSVRCPIELANGGRYRAYVQVLAGGVYSIWTFAEFSISLVAPAMPTAVVTLLPNLGAMQLTIQARDSMLSAEGSRTTNDWSAVDSCLVTLSTSFLNARSSYAARVTSTVSSATMHVRTVTRSPVVPNYLYTAACSFVGDVGMSPAGCRVGIEFIDGTGSSLGLTWSGTVSDVSGQRAVVTVTSPLTAVSAQLWTEMAYVANSGDVHFFYDPVLRPSVGDEWTPGGQLGLTTLSTIETSDTRIVRKGLDVPVPIDSQKIVLIDEEIPLGRDLTYSIITRAYYPVDVLASVPLTTFAGHWSSGWLWLSDPMRPGSAKPFGPKEFDVVTRPARQGKFRAIGRPDAIITRGTRGYEEGSYTIITHSKTERENYYDLAVNSDIVLLRVPPDQGEQEGETYYVRLEGDLPTKRALASRTPHREIEQAWTRQERPLDNLIYREEEDN